LNLVCRGSPAKATRAFVAPADHRSSGAVGENVRAAFRQARRRAKRVGMKVYFLGIAGAGMSALASLMASEGRQVTGSDGAVYPPVSTYLEGLGIPFHRGFDAAHVRTTSTWPSSAPAPPSTCRTTPSWRHCRRGRRRV
jgi:hypothetical protein